MANLNFPTSSSTKVAKVWGGNQALLDEGSLFIVTNTISTAVATTTSVVDAANSGATSAQTRPVAVMWNQGSAADPNARTIYPLYMNVSIPIGGQVPTSATSWQAAFWLDTVGAAAWTSGGTAFTPAAVNPAASGGRGSVLKLYFGAITAPATSGAGVMVGRRFVSNIIPVVGDEWMFTFGDYAMTSGLLLGAAVRKVTVPFGPICIPPGYSLKLGMWGASNAAAPSFEFELGYAERVSGL